ncbi:hypothetical protein JOM56_000170 [Amanita muscaria]
MSKIWTFGDSCRDGQRKERKKGIKRGPYKRKNKNGALRPFPTEKASSDGKWIPAQAAAANFNTPVPVAISRHLKDIADLSRQGKRELSLLMDNLRSQTTGTIYLPVTSRLSLWFTIS